MRLVYGLETKRTLGLERSIAKEAKSIALTSAQEAELFRTSVGGGATAIGITNGVDTNYFRYQ